MVSVGIFSVVPPTEPCALRSTQPLKVSTRDFFWAKGGRCVWQTIYHPCSAETSRKSGALIYPEPLGPPRSVAGHLYFTFTLLMQNINYEDLYYIFFPPFSYFHRRTYFAALALKHFPAVFFLGKIPSFTPIHSNRVSFSCVLIVKGVCLRRK